jgi:hypothetical protein
VAGQDSTDSLDERPITHGIPDRPAVGERLHVKRGPQLRATEHGLYLGGEQHTARNDAVVQRLDAEAVSREQQPFAVGDSESEHPAQVVDAAVPEFLVQMDDDLDIAVRGKPVAHGFQLSAQLAVVVDLPVDDRADLAVLAVHGLSAAGYVHDAEPPHAEPQLLACVKARVVGSPVRQRRGHGLDGTRTHGAPGAGDAAQVRSPSASQ